MSHDDVEILKTKVDKILFYLHNDEGTGEKGLIAQVKVLQKDFSEFVIAYKTEKAIKKAKLGVIGAIGGGVVTFLIWFVEQIIKHLHF